MAQVTLLPDTVNSTGTWSGFTVANLGTSNNVYATSPTDGGTFTPGVVGLEAAPSLSTFNSATFHIEASAGASSGRTKTVLVELLNAAGTVIASFTTSTLTTTDATYNSGTVTGAYTKADVDGWQVRVTAQEGGGMPGSNFARIDRIWLVLDYEEADTTAPSAPANFAVADGVEGPVLTWDNPADSDLDTIHVERSDDGSTGWAEVHTEPSPTPGATGVTWTDTDTTEGSTYFYRLRASDAVPNYSSYTAVESGTHEAEAPPEGAQLDLAGGLLVVVEPGSGNFLELADGFLQRVSGSVGQALTLESGFFQVVAGAPEVLRWAATYEAGVNGDAYDDGYRERLGGTFSFSGTGIVVGDNGSQEQDLFVRLKDVTIPQGATIVEARFEFFYLGSSTNAGRLTDFEWRAVAVDDAVSPTSAAEYDAQQANLTTTKVDDQTTGPYTAGDPWQSQDVGPVIQEIVDRSGWASGNDIVLHGTHTTSNFTQAWRSSLNTLWSVFIDYLA